MYSSTTTYKLFINYLLEGSEQATNSSEQMSVLSAETEAINALIHSMASIIQLSGAVFLIYGATTLVMAIARDDSYGFSFSTYDSYSNTLNFWVLEKRNFKSIDVKLDGLSENTISILRNKIETPLKELYEAASKGKRAKDEYRNCSVYISSLAEDLNKAISQCENELMEQKLIDKLYIIEDAITNIKDRINDAIVADKDEERKLKELQLKSYEPFTLTDCMNKLY